MGWLITALVLALLAIAPLGVSAAYDSGGPLVRLIAGPVRLQLFPAKKKREKRDKKEKKAPSKLEEKAAGTLQAQQEKLAQLTKPKPKPETPEPRKQGGKLQDFLPLVQLALDFLGDFRRKLRVNRLELDLVLAGGDPCDLAINYGRACGALGNLWPRLEEWFVIQKRDVKIQCDFEADTTVVTARLDLTITLGRLVRLAVGYGFRALKEFMKLNKRKGGAAV